MKRIFSLFSFVFLFTCFFTPLLIIMAMNGTFGAYGEFTLLLWVVFPLLGMIFACFGKKGWIKMTGILLNGTALGFVLFIIISRTGYL